MRQPAAEQLAFNEAVAGSLNAEPLMLSDTHA
jgi:hypothetical protein